MIFFFYLLPVFFLNGLEFPHPNHELKFPALDAKMATRKLHSQCVVVKNRMLPILTVPLNENCPNLKLLTKQLSKFYQSFLVIILLAKWV
jgi:hypothetical protein